MFGDKLCGDHTDSLYMMAMVPGGLCSFEVLAYYPFRVSVAGVGVLPHGEPGFYTPWNHGGSHLDRPSYTGDRSL